MSNPTWRSIDLGPVDAYAMAVEMGYTGTHEEFVQQMFHTKDYSEKSEAYAVGQVNGEDVDSDHPAYENNSKYYSEVSADEAGNAHSERLLAEAALMQAEQALSLDVAAWLEDNMSNPDSPSLDRTLKLSLAAAPADMTGNLQQLFYKEVKKLNITTYSISTWESNYKIKLEGDSGIGSIIFANGWKVSEKISMEGIAQLQIYKSPAAGTAVAYIVYYDASDNYLNHEEMPGGMSGQAAREVPNNTDYVRISSNISDNNNITVKRGTTEDGAIYTALAEKTDKVSGATAGNLAALDANGNLVDSGIPAAAIAALLSQGNNE